MIRLHPRPDVLHECPYCRVRLDVQGWYIPGMRNLADLRCLQCGRAFYGDLPAGHGLYYPALLEQATGEVHDPYQGEWFAGWLKTSFAYRQSAPVAFSVETFRPLKRVVLLNCLDRLYGHCLLKLLNAQYYLDQCPEFDLVVLIPRLLRWLVPDGVAAIWTVDLPLDQCILWHNWLAAEIKRQLEPLGESWLSVGFSHPDSHDYAIERFSRVKPFDLETWLDGNLTTEYTVSYIWRDDRTWTPPRTSAQTWLRRVWRERPTADPQRQQHHVIRLAEALRRTFPTLRFNVIGLGQAGGLPGWIQDARTRKIDDALERRWCEKYARSHLVIGIHGSNMLLPSSHAASALVLMPEDRWANRYQDLLPDRREGRLALCRSLLLPASSTPETVAHVAATLLEKLPLMALNLAREWSDHEATQGDPFRLQKRRQQLLGIAKR